LPNRFSDFRVIERYSASVDSPVVGDRPASVRIEEGRAVARLTDQVAIVTGASRGIGRSVAQELAREGAAVVAAARTSSALDELAAEIMASGGRALAVRCDVRDPAEARKLIDRALSAYGRIDIVVNAAQGAVGEACVEDYPLDDVRAALDSGFYGTLAVMQAAFEPLRSRGGGRIVNFGDTDAVVGEPGKLGTNVAKEAIRALSRTAAREWGRYGIYVNVVDPLARTERLSEEFEHDPEREAWLTSQIPSGVIGDPTGVARAVVFLASDDSRMLTGMSVNVDGGRGMYS
jgi:NAD(P)-dependent dehydrogenase (short-subunit alcohol dehydrogenase family)